MDDDIKLMFNHDPIADRLPIKYDRIAAEMADLFGVPREVVLSIPSNIVRGEN